MAFRDGQHDGGNYNDTVYIEWPLFRFGYQIPLRSKDENSCNW